MCNSHILHMHIYLSDFSMVVFEFWENVKWKYFLRESFSFSPSSLTKYSTEAIFQNCSSTVSLTSKLKRKSPLLCQSVSEEQPCEPVAVSGLPAFPGGNSSPPSASLSGPSAHMQQRCHSAHLYSHDPYSQRYLLSTGCQCSFSTNCSGPSHWPAAKMNSL